MYNPADKTTLDALAAKTEQRDVVFRTIPNADILAQPIADTPFAWLASNLDENGITLPDQTVDSVMEAMKLVVFMNPLNHDFCSDEEAKRLFAELLGGSEDHGPSITSSKLADTIRKVYLYLPPLI